MKPTLKSLQAIIDEQANEIAALSERANNTADLLTKEVANHKAFIKQLATIASIPNYERECRYSTPAEAEVVEGVMRMKAFISRYEGAESDTHNEVAYLRDLLRVVLKDPRIERGSDATATRDRLVDTCNEERAYRR